MRLTVFQTTIGLLLPVAAGCGDYAAPPTAPNYNPDGVFNPTNRLVP
jgi:hypothetical protein